MNLLLNFITLSLSVVAFAAPAPKTLYHCTVSKVDQKAVESFGEFELDVYDPRVDHIQPDAHVSVQHVKTERSKKAELRLKIGKNAYSGAKTYHRKNSPDTEVSYIVYSDDVEVGYILSIDAFGDREGTLFGFTSDLRKGELAEDRAEYLATLNCPKVR